MGDLALIGVLGVPALAAILLGFLPGYHLEARLNVLAALLSFLSALVFLISRPEPGHVHPGRRLQRLPDRAQQLRRLHDQHLLGDLHRPRAGDRSADPGLSALLPRHVPGDAGSDEPGTAGQQYRPAVGRGRGGDPLHGGDGRHLPHAAGAGGGVEVLHPGLGRHSTGLVRHDARLSRRPGGPGRWPGRHGAGPAGRQCRQVRPGAARSGLRLSPGRLRHQGRSRPAARLAPRRPCRRADPDLGRPLGSPAQCRALCPAALQDGHGGESGRPDARPAHGRPGSALASASPG